MEKKVTIGRVLKPRGLSGEVKVQVFTNKPEVFDHVANIERITLHGGFAFIKFKGVDCVGAADKLRGHEITIPRELLTVDDDEILMDDLLGFTVVDTAGKKLGVVREVLEVGAGAVIDIGTTMFPYEDEFVAETNRGTRTIVIYGDKMQITNYSVQNTNE